jgi:hypothetical protein
MNTNTRLNSELSSQTKSVDGNIRRHKLPMCKRTGLARYRDRHQARQGADAKAAGADSNKTATFACPDCKGFHLEKIFGGQPAFERAAPAMTYEFTSSPADEKRRYVLFDVENPTHGAKATSQDLAALWRLIEKKVLGITPDDHIVIGAARYVVRRYRAAVQGANIKWVVGADAPDGADRALLAAINLHRVARDFDELVIISGDRAFAELARRAKALGLSVHVITAEHSEQRSMLSRELAAAADIQTLLCLESSTAKHNTLTPIRPTWDQSHERARVEIAAA